MGRLNPLRGGTPLPFIKAGYVFVWSIDDANAGYRAMREARSVETALWKLFGRRPRP